MKTAERKTARRRMTSENRDLIRRMFAEGAQDKEIAAALGFPIRDRTTIRYYRKQLGLMRSRAGRPVTEEEKEAVRQLAPFGLSRGQMAAQLGMGTCRLWHITESLGIEMREGYSAPLIIPKTGCADWARLMAGRLYPDAAVGRARYFRRLPPATHIETQSSSAQAVA